MTIWKTTLLGAAVGIIGVGFAAQTFAAGGGGGKMGKERPAFETIDTDGDGTITMAEIKALSAARFAQVDTNADGNLDREELLAAAADKARGNAEKHIDRMIAWQDENGDGVLSAEEMPSDRLGKMFQRMDADGNGEISAEEYEEAKKRGGRHGKKGKRENSDDNAQNSDDS